MSDSAEIQAAIVELQDLWKRKPLKGAEKAKAKALMRLLREAEYSPVEISQATGWSVPSVKNNTAGVKVVDPTAKTAISKKLGEMVSRRLTLDQVSSVS
jgi:hypothetical protein